MKVLIADDDPVTLDTLEILLVQLGHEALRATDGREAWGILKGPDAPQLAILDWMMPGVEGVEICRRLRQNSDGPYQYLIMLTAKDNMGDLVASIEAGADDYLRKPFDERELLARLRAGERILTLQNELRARAMTDGLTGLLNRETILSRLHRELALAARVEAPVSVILIDLDNFKSINDSRGHAIGDDVLREASKRMAARMRTYDELGRYGGEEFLVVLPRCALERAAEVAERMREVVAALPVDTRSGPVRLTSSLGVATFDPAHPDVDALLARADEALYRAKRGGRNRVEVVVLGGPESLTASPGA